MTKLSIHYNIYADDYLHVWSNMEFSDEYPFTRKEKAVIELYRQSN